MKKGCRFLLVLLAMLGGSRVFAASYPGEVQMRAAIEHVVELVRAEGMELEMRDAQKEGVKQPLMAAGINVTSGICRVYYNTRPEEGLQQFFAGLEEKDMPIWLAAIAAHEVAHCVEQREAYIRKRFDRVLPTHFVRGDMTVQGYLSVVKSGAVETWGEALADIVSVLYLKKTVPDAWPRFAGGIASMRHDLARRWPQHDTSPWLRRVIAADPQVADNQSIFDVAFELRRQFRPQ